MRNYLEHVAVVDDCSLCCFASFKNYTYKKNKKKKQTSGTIKKSNNMAMLRTNMVDIAPVKVVFGAIGTDDCMALGRPTAARGDPLVKLNAPSFIVHQVLYTRRVK